MSTNQPGTDEASASSEQVAESATESAAASPAEPAAAQASESGDWAEEEGDDAGNVAESSESAEGSEAAEGAPGAKPSEGKKRRRRRKKKAPQGPAAAGAEGAEGTEGATEGESPGEGEGGEGGEGDAAKKRGRRDDRSTTRVGADLFGKVVGVSDEVILIDIPGKTFALFDRREIAEGEPIPAEGDTFVGTVASTSVRGCFIVLSRKAPNLEEARKLLDEGAQTGATVTGLVVGAVKGGIEVDFGGLRAFAPASQVTLRPGSDLNALVGRRLDFVVLSYARKGRDVVVSRKKFLDAEAQQARAEAQEARAQAAAGVEVGAVLTGIVRGIAHRGVFVALPSVGNVEGMIEIEEVSHDRGARMSDLFRMGQEIEVKVLRKDDKGKIWLSRKAVTANPWDAVADKYAVFSRHEGKVVRLQPFGAFVELEPGIDGLIHTADLSFQQIYHPSEVVKVGDAISVVVASVDGPRRRIALNPAPPAGEELETKQRIAPGRVVKVAVVSASEPGLVVRVVGYTGRQARGFIPAAHTGVPRGGDLRKEMPAGKVFDAKVLEVDKRGETKLSVRALKDDAERSAYQEYRAGVQRDAKFGTFADLFRSRLQRR